MSFQREGGGEGTESKMEVRGMSHRRGIPGRQSSGHVLHKTHMCVGVGWEVGVSDQRTRIQITPGLNPSSWLLSGTSIHSLALKPLGFKMGAFESWYAISQCESMRMGSSFGLRRSVQKQEQGPYEKASSLWG